MLFCKMFQYLKYIDFFVFFLLILYLSRIVHIQFGKPRVQFRETLVGNFAETLANLVERSIKMLVAVSL